MNWIPFSSRIGGPGRNLSSNDQVWGAICRFWGQRQLNRSPRGHGEPVGVSTGRLEAFSDGVIAVAITLLVLNIHVPAPPLGAGKTLAHELARNWPVYAAYVTSFLTIGIIWINHHVMIRRLRERRPHDPVPQPPAADEHRGASVRDRPDGRLPQAEHGQHLAAAIYSGAFLRDGAVLRDAEPATSCWSSRTCSARRSRLRAAPADPRPQRQRRDPLRDRDRAGDRLAVRHARDLRRARGLLRVPDRSGGTAVET